MLAEAQRQLHDVLDHAEAQGRHYASLIDEATHLLKDGKWANFEDWVDRNADWIERYTDNLGWVATGLAIGAIFLPGANILVLTAIGITAVSAATHATLLATGNGSWGDMALDVLALATLGAGAAATKGLKGAQLAARTAAAAEARDVAAEAVRRAARNEARAAIATLNRSGSSTASKLTAQEALNAIDRTAVEEGTRAARAVMNQPMSVPSRWEALAVGEPKTAGAYKDLLRTAAQHSGVLAVDDALTAGARYYGAAQTSYLTGSGADLYGKRDGLEVIGRGLFRIVQGSSWVPTPEQGAPA